VLYGHKEQSVALAVPAAQIDAAVRHGARLVQLSGALNEQAFIRELQWDTWGKEILHVDFTRVSAHERVEVTVPVELRGVAPGTRTGGVLEHLIHEIPLECEVTELPDKLAININHLGVGDSVTAGQIELPPTARILIEADEIVVQCVEPAAVPEEEAAAAPGAEEPEVIRRRGEEEEGAEE
jgi:large subunit ribosomal protein L25